MSKSPDKQVKNRDANTAEGITVKYVNEIARAMEQSLAVDEMAADGDTREVKEFFREVELAPKRVHLLRVPDRNPDATSITRTLPGLNVSWWELEDGTVLGLVESGDKIIIPPDLEIPQVKDYLLLEVGSPTVPRDIRHAVAEEVQRQEDKIIGGCGIEDLRPFVLCGLEIGYKIAKGDSVDIAQAIRECGLRSWHPKDSPVVTYDEAPLVPGAI